MLIPAVMKHMPKLLLPAVMKHMPKLLLPPVRFAFSAVEKKIASVGGRSSFLFSSKCCGRCPAPALIGWFIMV